MLEWLKRHDWKSCVRLNPYRGFESLSLHQSLAATEVSSQRISRELRQAWKGATVTVNLGAEVRLL